MWLYSRERATALQRANYTCQECGAKKTQKVGEEVKVEVHHIEGVGNWEKIIKLIREELLCSPDKLKVLCTDCHKKEDRKSP